MDSTRVLHGLLALASQAEAAAVEDDPLDGIIATPVLRSLLTALHYRDIATMRHSRRVAMLAVGIAELLGWEGRPLRCLEVAALLHDVGKIGVPDQILFKPTRLSPDEAELMALHQHIAVDVLQACRLAPDVLTLVAGSRAYLRAAGPSSTGDLPIGARVLSIADAYDSLASDQVYRQRKSHDEIMQILTEHAGTQFDGNIVSALGRWTSENGLPLVGSVHGEIEPDAGAEPPSVDGIDVAGLVGIFSHLYMLENLYDGFFLVDEAMNFVVWNHGLEKLLGHSARGLLRQRWEPSRIAYADEQGQPLADTDVPLFRVVRDGKQAIRLGRVRDAEGNSRSVEIQTVPLIDETYGLMGAAEVFRDLSRPTRKLVEDPKLRLAATVDPLTAVSNRGDLEAQLARLMEAFQAGGPAFSVLFLDIDHFKSINDRYGHRAGDVVLAQTGRLLRNETYCGEIVGRYGGEEFLILCPETGLEQAAARAERLRGALHQLRIAELCGKQMSASFGVTTVDRSDTIESLLQRADRALYQAKGAGRNRTCIVQAVAPQAAVHAPAKPAPRLVHEASFQAFLTGEMILFKLGGFVQDLKARILEVTPTTARLRVGQSLLPFWGTSPQSQPVLVELRISDPLPIGADQRNRNHRREVTVTVTPVGWVFRREAFQARARDLVCLLQGYFLAVE